jgi:hypothetical protein
MIEARQATLADQALSEIDQLLNNFDWGGQIEFVLPLLLRHRRTLTRLRDALKSIPVSGTHSDVERWSDDIQAIFRKHGGHAPHPQLNRKMKELRQTAGRSCHRMHAASSGKHFRRTMQRPHNIEAGPISRMVRPGLWRLKDFATH